MKNKVLAVLLAVCMIAGSCALFASAATFASGTYVEKTNSSGDLLASNIKAINTNAFNISVTVAAKTGITMNAGTTEVTDSNVDDLVSFKSGTSTLTFASNLASYFTVSGTISGNTANITFADKTANDLEVYQVTSDIDSTSDTDISAKVSLVSNAKKYILSSPTVSATISKWVTKLSSVTMGVRFFGSTYENLVASEVAKVDAIVTRNGNGSLTQKVTSSVTNVIKDLMPGDTVELEAKLKSDSEKDFYGFYCWVDANGNVQSTNSKIKLTVDGNDVAIYATFVELKNRHTISYSIGEHGKVLYEQAREVFDGVGQVSVMDGKPATFDFVPDEDYMISKVIVDGKNISSLKSIDLDAILKGDLSSLKAFFKTTGQRPLSFTFSAADPDWDHTIEVYFEPVGFPEDDGILKAPSGMTMETVTAGDESLTLPEGAENGGKGGNGGNGGSDGTTVPGEDGAAGSGGAVGGVVNPATGSTGAIAVFAALSVAAAAAFVTAKKKEN